MKIDRTSLIIAAIILAAACLASAQTLTSPNYFLLRPRIVSSGGEANSASYSMSCVEIGNVFGGVAASANYTLDARLFFDACFIPRLSVALNPAGWPLNAVMPGASRITTGNEKIIVSNDGNVKEAYSLQVVDASGTWQAADTVGENGINKYVMSGIFTNLERQEAPDSDFNESGGDDLILEGAPQRSSSIRYAATSSDKNGTGILPNEKRALWLKFNAPNADTTKEEHDIAVVISAEPAE